jgi:HEAT repeat protein
MKIAKRLLLLLTAVLILAAGIVLAVRPFRESALAGYHFLKGDRLDGGKDVGYWAAALKDPDPDVRKEAIGAVRRLGPDAAETVPVLTVILTTPDHREEKRASLESAQKECARVEGLVRENGATQAELEQRQAAVETAKQQLIAARKISGLRISAADALAQMGPAARSAVPALIEALSANDLMLRLKTAVALTTIGQAAPSDVKPAVPALIKALKDEDNRVAPLPFSINIRGQVAAALGCIGPEAKEAIPALVEALKSNDPDSRMAAASALGKLEAMEAIPALVDALNADSAQLKINAALALARFGPEARAAVPGLIRALKDNQDLDRFHRIAAEALGKIGPDAKAAVPDLILALQSEDGGIASAAAEALGKIGDGAKVAVPELIKRLGTDDPYLQRNVIESIKKLDPQAAKDRAL